MSAFFYLPERNYAMPYKLKDLKISKVDFVDEGANQQANIVLLKRKEDAAKGGEEMPGSPIKKFFTAIAKAVGLKDEEAAQVAEEIEKSGAMTFAGKQGVMQQRRISSEIWDACNAIEDSLCSIMRDEDVADKSAMMKQSIDEFAAAMKGYIDSWAAGQPAAIKKEAGEITPERAAELEVAKSKIEELLKTAKKPPALEGGEGKKEETTPKKTDKAPAETKKSKEENDEMKIDKSKLSPEELATLKSIEKKAGIPEATGQESAQPPAPTAKSKEAGAQDDDKADIYKGLHPAVVAELKELRKRADAAEERELEEVAKKYEIIGKKKDELVPILKELKAAGGNAYASMLAALDASVEMVNKSGLFTEIGKRGVGTDDGDKAWSAIEKKAEEIKKSKPEMSMPEAIDLACQQNPELVRQYEGNK